MRCSFFYFLVFGVPVALSAQELQSVDTSKASEDVPWEKLFETGTEDEENSSAVDEAAQLALLGEDLLAQVGVLGGKRGEHFAHRGAGDGDGIPRRRELTQGRRDQYLGHVSKSAPLLALRFDRSWAESSWRGETRLFESIARRRNTTGRNFVNRWWKNTRRNRDASDKFR